MLQNDVSKLSDMYTVYICEIQTHTTHCLLFILITSTAY